MLYDRPCGWFEGDVSKTDHPHYDRKMHAPAARKALSKIQKLVTPNSYYTKGRARHRDGCFHNLSCYHALMKADLRISVKDYRRSKNLKICFAGFFRPAPLLRDHERRALA